MKELCVLHRTRALSPLLAKFILSNVRALYISCVAIQNVRALRFLVYSTLAMYARTLQPGSYMPYCHATNTYIFIDELGGEIYKCKFAYIQSKQLITDAHSI